MADQDQCPECGERFPGPCERTAHRCASPKPVIYQRKSAPGKLRDPDRDASDISPDLPDEVLDRAVDTALTAMWGDGYEGVEDDVREAIHAAAPMLVEHGRQQERARVEPRMLGVEEAIRQLVFDREDDGDRIEADALARGAAAERERIRGLLDGRWVDPAVLAALARDGDGGQEAQGHDFSLLSDRDLERVARWGEFTSQFHMELGEVEWTDADWALLRMLQTHDREDRP